jgi:hypothetical protein
VAVRKIGRSGVVGLAGEVDAPPAVGPDMAPDGNWGVQIDQTPSLLDVQLDESGDPAKSFRVAADPFRIATRGSHGVRHADPIGIGQRPGAVGRDRSGDHPRAGACDPESSTFLVHEVDHADRAFGPPTSGVQAIDRRKGADHTERAVKRSAIRHAVQV